MQHELLPMIKASKWQEALTKSRPFLSQMDTPGVLPHLMAQGLINVGRKESIMNRSRTDVRNLDLIDTLLGNGNAEAGFNTLLGALRHSGQDNLATLLYDQLQQVTVEAEDNNVASVPEQSDGEGAPFLVKVRQSKRFVIVVSISLLVLIAAGTGIGLFVFHGNDSEPPFVVTTDPRENTPPSPTILSQEQPRDTTGTVHLQSTIKGSSTATESTSARISTVAVNLEGKIQAGYLHLLRNGSEVTLSGGYQRNSVPYFTISFLSTVGASRTGGVHARSRLMTAYVIVDHCPSREDLLALLQTSDFSPDVINRTWTLFTKDFGQHHPKMAYNIILSCFVKLKPVVKSISVVINISQLDVDAGDGNYLNESFLSPLSAFEMVDLKLIGVLREGNLVFPDGLNLRTLDLTVFSFAEAETVQNYDFTNLDITRSTIIIATPNANALWILIKSIVAVPDDENRLAHLTVHVGDVQGQKKWPYMLDYLKTFLQCGGKVAELLILKTGIWPPFKTNKTTATSIFTKILRTKAVQHLKLNMEAYTDARVQTHGLISQIVANSSNPRDLILELTLPRKLR